MTTQTNYSGSNQASGAAMSRKRISVTVTSLWVLSMMFGMVWFGAGCKHSEKRAADAAQAAALAVPVDMEIHVGRAGGFAGRMTGYTIAADGAVVEWEGKFPGENVRGEAENDMDRAVSLWQHAVESNILDTSEQAMGTAYWFVTVTADGESRRVSWAEWPEEGAELSKAQEFYNTCVDMAKKALGR